MWKVWYRRKKGGCLKPLFVLLTAVATVSVVLYNMLPSVMLCSAPYSEPLFDDKPDLYYEASDPAKKPFLVWSPECKIPNLDPFDPSLSWLMGPPQIANCSTRPPLTHVRAVDDSRQWFALLVDVRPSVVRLYAQGDVSCCYSVVARITLDPSKRPVKNVDMHYTISSCEYFDDKTLLPPETEFILVRCFTPMFVVFSKEVYSNMHAVVPLKKTVSDKIKAKQKKMKDQNEAGSNSLSVLLLGLDGTSRLNLIRKMPSTITHLKNHDWFELAGYNKIGQNTLPNIFPLLTGLRIGSPTNGTCFHSYEHVFDDCPFLWKSYSDRGFVTASGEDEPYYSTFNFIKAGFLQPPTDYYLRPYMLALYDKVVTKFTHVQAPCFDSMEITDHLLWYVRDFAATFKNNLFFGMFWLNNFSHDDHNSLAAFDHKFHDFLLQLHEHGVMNNTMVVFFSDHGMRIGKMVQLQIRRFEDRLPFMYIWLPKWYRKQNKLAARNLMINGGRLTSPLDIYKTLKYNIMQSESADDHESGNPYFCENSRSLFEEIPLNRTCDDACIPPEWCTCVTYLDLPKDDVAGVEVMHYVVKRLRYIVDDTLKLTINTYAQCAQLSLQEIIKISKSAENKYAVEEYVVQFVMTPGGGVFEATVRHHKKESTYELVGKINRLSRYGSQSWCIDDTVLKDYCYCETR